MPSCALLTNFYTQTPLTLLLELRGAWGFVQCLDAGNTGWPWDVHAANHTRHTNILLYNLKTSYVSGGTGMAFLLFKNHSATFPFTNVGLSQDTHTHSGNVSLLFGVRIRIRNRWIYRWMIWVCYVQYAKILSNFPPIIPWHIHSSVPSSLLRYGSTLYNNTTNQRMFQHPSVLPTTFSYYCFPKIWNCTLSVLSVSGFIFFQHWQQYKHENFCTQRQVQGQKQARVKMHGLTQLFNPYLPADENVTPFCYL